jgi:hypothetical protein
MEVMGIYLIRQIEPSIFGQISWQKSLHPKAMSIIPNFKRLVEESGLILSICGLQKRRFLRTAKTIEKLGGKGMNPELLMEYVSNETISLIKDSGANYWEFPMVGQFKNSIFQLC